MEDEFNFLALNTLSKIITNLGELEGNVANIDGCSKTIVNNIYFERKTEYYLARHKVGNDPKSPQQPTVKEAPAAQTPPSKSKTTTKSISTKTKKASSTPSNPKPTEKKVPQPVKPNILIEISDDPEFQIGM
ncbi:hypothetical protein GPJ56_003875 [Histomonas meleagridis]|uniref:uncharacterized protein n=1 Tax=Histomonas meleagridis TaxID=135588 RepID=UPI00355A9A56|nr:hypothetical protein GPJ56_003875 [Histomonas meleagridis]KAH0805334.1 hypothetical protein GO595_002279 [Histomonas meleagridis]